MSDNLSIAKRRLGKLKSLLISGVEKVKRTEQEKDFINWIKQLDEENTKDMKKFFIFIGQDIKPIFERLKDNKKLIKDAIRSVLISKSGIKDPNIYNDDDENLIYDYFEMFNDLNNSINS
jgi:hypothetical protein